MIDPDRFPVQEGYAAWASFYDGDGNPLTEIEGPAVRFWFAPAVERGGRALDLGCGTGRHTAAILDAGAAAVIGLDMTPEMLSIARAKLAGRPALVFRHRFPDPLPHRDATFGLAVLGLVAEHLVDLPAALTDVARVLNPGGRCVLSALHPDRTAEGQTARFIDPETGLRRTIATLHRTENDYLAAAASAGLNLVGVQSLTVPPELAERLPRAAPYVGRNLGWVGCWSKPA